MLIARVSAPKYRNYRKYRPYVRRSFKCRCVYCLIHETELGGPRFFTIDHLIPRSVAPFLKNTYENLLYACDECNSFKKDDWNAGDPLVVGRGYLDPCKYDYDTHFHLIKNTGKIKGLSKIAIYMIERLWLNRPLVVNVRVRRHWDGRKVDKIEKLILKANDALNVVAGSEKQNIKEIIRDLELQKNTITARLLDIASCRPETEWKLRTQTRLVARSRRY
ncbi:MAG: HNH endonuclease [Chloroflexi bacterium]|nr:HNH endonuclease [Chloroflexota bacterium]